MCPRQDGSSGYILGVTSETSLCLRCTEPKHARMIRGGGLPEQIDRSDIYVPRTLGLHITEAYNSFAADSLK